MNTPCYHIQVQSYGGGFLSTADVTTIRAEVGEAAMRQASCFIDWPEARQPYFGDGMLRITDQNNIKDCRAAVLSTYRWNPVEGRWSHSSGTRIAALDAA